jgi:sulfoacetaldehyde acetyltransferase
MNDMARGDRKVVSGKVRMTPSEAFVETMVAQGVTDIFGIVGSAYMDALDIFRPRASASSRSRTSRAPIHMADGYSRVSGRHGVCIGRTARRHQLRDRRGRGVLGALPGRRDHTPRPAR